ncbi:MAG TPA: LLM class flavin-dependent oxidoreductase [Nitrososphaeraceae archaeon]|nr:LLM class flavin-dependent oxidoreductase [Nitrososphaeraceae archaeon]
MGFYKGVLSAMAKFGCYIYQEGQRFEDIISTVRECERWGFDSIWLKDNLLPWLQSYVKEDKNAVATCESDNDVVLECWTTLSSLASITQRIRLGAILVNSYRTPPSLLAKMVSTLDIISRGRLEFGLSAGWYRKEFEAYGFDFLKASARVEMLEESIKIIKMMLTESSPVSFSGKYFKVNGAVCNPKPIQRPYPPLWIGGGGKRTIEIAAKHANGWNYGLCLYEEYVAKLSLLKNCCKLVNRDHQNIMKGWQGLIIIGKHEDDVKIKISDLQSKKGIKDDGLSKISVVGTTEQVQTEIAKYISIGVDYFTASFPDLESLELFAERIMPQFKT